MIKEKKILLICRESSSIPLFFLAKKLLSDGNEIGAFFIHSEEGYYNKSMYNKNTYYNFKENLDGIKLYGLKDLCEKFNDNCLQSKFDLNYLNKIEQEYCHYKNLNLQLTSSQLTTRHFHSRFYFIHSTFEQNLIFLELAYRKVIEVLDDYKPDIILDIEDAELLRTIINEVSFKRNIPYINIDYPRYEGYKIPTYCLGLKTEKYLDFEYNRYCSMPADKLTTEYEYVKNFRNGTEIMSQEFNGTITSQYKPDNLFYMCKVLFGMLMYFWNVLITSGNWRLIKTKQIIYSNPIKHFLFYLKVAVKRQYLFRKNVYFDPPNNIDSYVYMPLHLIPESTTFVKAPFYINELNIIEQVSKSLPIGWKLYVKEHQAMVGERDFSFYRAVKKLPNVKLVEFNFYSDPKPWIQNSKGVIAISGTGAYEAAMLGKKSIVFADVPFTLIEGVYHVRSFHELPSLIASFGPIDNMKSCASYIAAIKSTGKDINLKYLMAEGEAIIRKDHAIEVKFQNEIDKLAAFFSQAYTAYLSRI